MSGDGAAATETLQGEVTRIIFANPDNGYKVLRLVDDAGVEHTLCGVAPGVEEKSTVEARGVWRRHTEYGQQFCADSCLPTLPASAAGIRRFLGSGIIPGIGAKLAGLIVESFGDETIDVLDSHTNRLRELPGVGKKKLAAIREGWKAHSDRRNTFIFLQGLGITPAYCARLYKRYGDAAGETVRNHPYKLTEVDGIGFIKADRIARELGVPADSPERAAAAALYCVGQKSDAGHVCYPEAEVARELATLLAVEPPLVQQGIEQALETRALVRDDAMLYLPRLYRAEVELPKHVKRLSCVKTHAGARLRRMPPRAGTPPLSDEQLVAVDTVARAPLSIITGGPGVGKTTVLGEIVRRAHAAKLKIALAAPTGRAAKRLSEASGVVAKTLHRLLIFDPASGGFQYTWNNPLEADLILVDEVSMLDLNLALALFRAVKTGATLVLIGDADQLPSVGAGSVLDDFIHSNWFALTCLTKIFRQSHGSAIITNAHRVNAGVMPENAPNASREKLNDFYWMQQDDPDVVPDRIDKLLERIPERFGFDPIDEVQILTPMNRGPVGTVGLNARLQARFNPDTATALTVGERSFRLRDKVMQTANNYDKNVFNGDLGRIVAIQPATRMLDVRFDGGATVRYAAHELDELTLAYAITVHKSQGCEFPAVILVLLNSHYLMLQRNLLYTAMTRAKKLLVLIGSRQAVRMAVENAHKELRYGNLSKRLAALDAITA